MSAIVGKKNTCQKFKKKTPRLAAILSNNRKSGKILINKYQTKKKLVNSDTNKQDNT